MFFDTFFFMQILLESLPISSSGHLYLMGLQAPWWIDFCSHGPTVVMLLIYLAPEWYYWVRRWRTAWCSIVRFILLLALSELVTGALFLVKWSHFFPEPVRPLGWFLTGLMLLSLLFKPRVTREQVGIREALLIGAMQGVGPLFGLSRLASTVAVGCWAGLSSRNAFLYSCALQVPLFGAGGCLGCWKALQHGILEQGVFSALNSVLLLGSMVGAYLLLAFAQRLLERGWWWLFGIYLISLSVLVTFF